MTYMWSLLCYINRITFCISIFAIDLDGFRFNAIWVYDVTPEEEDEICRDLLKQRAKILIPVGILYCLIFAVSFVWLLGTSEELNPLMQWEIKVFDYVTPILNNIDFKWYAYSLDLLRVAVILAPIGIINVSPYIIFSYIVDTFLIRRRVKALIQTYSKNA